MPWVSDDGACGSHTSSSCQWSVKTCGAIKLYMSDVCFDDNRSDGCRDGDGIQHHSSNAARSRLVVVGFTLLFPNGAHLQEKWKED